MTVATKAVCRFEIASLRRCCAVFRGLGFRVSGLGFGVWGLGFRV